MKIPYFLKYMVYKICILIIIIGVGSCIFAEVNNSADEANELFDQLLNWHKQNWNIDTSKEEEYKSLLKDRDEIVVKISKLCEEDPNILIARLRYGTKLARGNTESLGWFIAYEITPFVEKLGLRLYPYCISVLKDENESWLMKSSVAGLLGYIKAKEAIPLLTQIALSENSHRILRYDSINAIEHIGIVDTETIKLLLPLLSASDEMIKRSTIWLMGSVKAKESASILHEILEKEQGPVAWDAMHALTKIEGSNAITWLKKCLESPDERLRNTAFNCIGDIDDPLVKEILREKLLASDPEIAGEASVYLRPYSDPEGRKAVLFAIDERRKMGLRSAPEMVRSIARGSDRVSWDLLLEYLEAPEPEYRAEAAKTLGSRSEYKEAIIILQNRLGIEKNELVLQAILNSLRNYNAIPETYKRKEDK